MNARLLRWIALGTVALTLASCASKPSANAAAAPATSRPEQSTGGYPILYHRTGGIAATDDRVVIWPDGLVQVLGTLMPTVRGRIGQDQMDKLVSSLSGWTGLKDHYLTPADDAYVITIYYRGKAVEATDINPDLPRQFRQAYVQIEAIAAQAANAPAKPANP